MKKVSLTLGLLLFSHTTIACPFCEFGASDVAFFIITVFGLFAVSGILLLIFFWRSGSFSSQDNTALQVLEAEGITLEREEGESERTRAE